MPFYMKTNIIRQLAMIVLPAIMCMGMLTSCDVDRMARGWKARILQAKDDIMLEKGKIKDDADIDSATQLKLENLASDVKTWETETEYYPWRHVALSILKYPEKVDFNGGKCPFCNHITIRMLFSSPSATWAMWCGTCGPLVFCPNCKKQLEYQCSTQS